jgi:hypothetical protein
MDKFIVGDRNCLWFGMRVGGFGMDLDKIITLMNAMRLQMRKTDERVQILEMQVRRLVERLETERRENQRLREEEVLLGGRG